MDDITLALTATPNAAETEPVTMPLRIAVASQDGRRVDQHFGQTEAFRVFDVTSGGAVQVDCRAIADHARADENSRATVCRMLADCTVLLVAKIGISPQEMLAGAGIEASDLHAGTSVQAALAAVFAAKTVVHDEVPLDASGFRLRHAMLRVSDLDRSLAGCGK